MFKRLWSGLFFGAGSVPTGDGLLASLTGGSDGAGAGGLPAVDPSSLDSDAVVHLTLDDDLTVVDRSVVEVGSPTYVLPL